ncbi:MAG: recombinase family protein, partial [Bacteroidales bacterium]|nr:recombinase family protein [Bacteroidales bacterium]
MNLQIIHTQLSELLEAIQEQYDTIRASEGLIPQIEIDILLGNVRKLYDQLHLLEKMNVQVEHTPSLHSPPHPVTTAPLHHFTSAPPHRDTPA